MKNILIDLYKIKDKYSGLGQFSLNFANELANQIPDEKQVDFLIPKKQEFSFPKSNLNVVEASVLKRYLPFMNKSYSIWHSLQQLPSFLPNKKSRWVLTVHDLNFLIEKNDSKKKKYLNKLQKNIDRADYITSISNYTKAQIEKNIDLKGKEVRVIYNGVATGENIKKMKPEFIQEKKFFFTIGILNAKKNFKVLVPIMKNFPNHQLIIAGNKDTNYGRAVEKEIKDLNLQTSVVLAGKISDEHKQWLYANCEAFLFPSLAEGFGLPVIEAMYEGKPVFLSKHTSLPEIGGSLAFYFDNFDTKQMSDLIKTKLESISNNLEQFEIDSKEYAKRFNWKTCIGQYLALYKEIESKQK